MFYSDKLLSIRKGKFGILWQAATGGLKKINKRDVISISIEGSCNELTEYISGNKKAKFSLYLSAQLSFGLIRIYHEKVLLVLREAQDLFSRSLIVFRPIDIQLEETRCDQVTQKERLELELPLKSQDDFGTFNLPDELFNSFMDYQITERNLESSFSLQARVEDITMNEVSVYPKYTNDYAFGDDFKSEFLTELDGSKEQLCHLTSTDNELVHDAKKHHNVMCLDRPDFQPTFVHVENVLQEVTNVVNLEANEQPINTTTLLHAENKTDLDAQPHQCLIIDENILPANTTDIKSSPAIIEENRRSERIRLKIDKLTDSTTIISTEQAPADATIFLNLPEDENRKNSEFNIPIVAELPPPNTNSMKRPLEISLSELRVSQLPLPKSRKRKINRKLIFDDTIEMTNVQLRDNVNNANDLLLQPWEVLASSDKNNHPKKIMAFSVPRLFALPANWETAVSRVLGTFWKSCRRQCESLSPYAVPESTSDLKSNELNKLSLNALHESDLEASKEEARANSNSAIFRPSSILGGSSNLDLTIQKNSTDLAEDKSRSASLIPALPILQEQEPFKHLHVDKIIEENPMDVIDIPQIPTSTDELLIHSPTIATMDKVPIFSNDESLMSYLDQKFANGFTCLSFDKLLPPSCTKKAAAKTFHSLLAILKTQKVTISQKSPFDSILIFPRCQ